MRKRWYLDNVDILDTLPDDQRRFFHQKAFRKSFPKDAVIFAPGDAGNLVYYLVQGRVKVYTLTADGKEIIYWFCHPKDFFGLAELCGGEIRTVFAETTEKSEALCIDKGSFEDLVRNNPEMSFLLMRVFGSRIRQAHEIIRDLVACDVRTRLARLITKLGQVCGTQGHDRIDLGRRFTHQELADMIGANRSTVTEAINDLKRQGIVRLSGGRLTILEPSRLKSFMDDGDLVNK